MPEEKPVMRIENGYTIIDIVVTAKDGFPTERGGSKFFELCKQYQEEHKRNVYARPVKETKIFERDCTSLMSLLTAACGEGDSIEFKVEGTDEIAEKMALRLYSGVTSKTTYEPDFYRFERGK